ncbi:MAG: Sir2 family NAD-dependent protein deacetylase, partial [Planctomycetota bacterium]
MRKLPEKLMEELRKVRSVGAITGAGVSQESGIQTYRGKGGIYDDPLEGERTVAALSGITLATDPDRTWVALAAMAQQARSARPNRGHLALAAMEMKVKHFVLLTQNV